MTEQKGIINFTPHYKVFNFNKKYDPKTGEQTRKDYTNDELWKNLKNIFPDGKANSMNMLIGSTSGVHGTYRTLDDLRENPIEEGNDHPDAFTILIIQPRACVLHCGTIGIRNISDEMWLRDLISYSLTELRRSQNGNLHKEPLHFYRTIRYEYNYDYRIKETINKGKTQFTVQKQVFRYFWKTISTHKNFESASKAIRDIRDKLKKEEKGKPINHYILFE